MIRHSRRSFRGGLRIHRVESIRLAVLKELAEIAPGPECSWDCTDDAHYVSAWKLARKINSLGSSVSSVMHKMWKRGEIERSDERTLHQGRRYKALRVRPAFVDIDQALGGRRKYDDITPPGGTSRPILNQLRWCARCGHKPHAASECEYHDSEGPCFCTRDEVSVNKDLIALAEATIPRPPVYSIGSLHNERPSLWQRFKDWWNRPLFTLRLK